MRRFIVVPLLAAQSALPTGAGAGAAWPERPVRFIVGFGAGGSLGDFA